MWQWRTKENINGEIINADLTLRDKNLLRNFCSIAIEASSFSVFSSFCIDPVRMSIVDLTWSHLTIDDKSVDRAASRINSRRKCPLAR